MKQPEADLRLNSRSPPFWYNPGASSCAGRYNYDLFQRFAVCRTTVSDPYFKLKPPEPTPAEECCSCLEISGVYLAHKLSDNPIYCMTCRYEVAPERIGFDDSTTERIARWHAVYRSIYRLWLDSSWYEAWAEAELLNKHSEVNRLGMLARDALAAYLPTTYLWFWQEERPTSCPVCGSSELSRLGSMRYCGKCSISL